MSRSSPSSPARPSSPVYSSLVTDRRRLSVPHTGRAKLAYQHTNHPSRANGAEARRPDLGVGSCSPNGITTLEPCRSPPRSRNVSKSGLSPIQADRESISSRHKVRSNTRSDSGSPTSSPSRVAPAYPSVISNFSLHAPFQTHQRHHESSAAESSTNRRSLHDQHIKVPSSSLVSLPAPSPSPSSTPPPRSPRQRSRTDSRTPTPQARPLSQHSVQLPTSPSSFSTRSRSIRCVHSAIVFLCAPSLFFFFYFSRPYIPAANFILDQCRALPLFLASNPPGPRRVGRFLRDPECPRRASRPRFACPACVEPVYFPCTASAYISIPLFPSLAVAFPFTHVLTLHSSTPSRRLPPSSVITRAFVPPSGPPTLAMSMQIHAPSPISSTQSKSTNMTSRASRSRSRPSSPSTTTTQLPLTRPPMPRPPSRSEKLLRDTLRRAEEQDRILALQALPSPSLFGATQPAHGFVPPRPGRRTRRDTSSSFSTENSLDAFAYCDTGACYSDEEDVNEDVRKPALLRTPSTSSSSSGNTQGYFNRVPLPRHHSDEPETRRRSSIRPPHFSEVYAEDNEGPARAQLQRSPRSAPSVSRSSFSQPPHTCHAHSVSRSPADPAERSPCGCQPATVTPHEAVLRSRLEGVLRSAKRQEERQRSREREYHTGSSGSMASSRNMSGEGDWFFAAAEVSYLIPIRLVPRLNTRIQSTSPTSLNYSTRTRSNTNSAPGRRQHRSPSMASQGLRSPASTDAPLTPPPTPPFNARVAAAQCKAMDGYVSFADIQGLGMPAGGGEDLDADEEAKSKAASWLKWLPLHGKRERSETR